VQGCCSSSYWASWCISLTAASDLAGWLLLSITTTLLLLDTRALLGLLVLLV
jgi:hypothetical protein